jgi:hypothetical protein
MGTKAKTGDGPTTNGAVAAGEPDTYV